MAAPITEPTAASSARVSLCLPARSAPRRTLRRRSAACTMLRNPDSFAAVSHVSAPPEQGVPHLLRPRVPHRCRLHAAQDQDPRRGLQVAGVAAVQRGDAPLITPSCQEVREVPGDERDQERCPGDRPSIRATCASGCRDSLASPRGNVGRPPGHRLAHSSRRLAQALGAIQRDALRRVGLRRPRMPASRRPSDNTAPVAPRLSRSLGAALRQVDAHVRGGHPFNLSVHGHRISIHRLLCPRHPREADGIEHGFAHAVQGRRLQRRRLSAALAQDELARTAGGW